MSNNGVGLSAHLGHLIFTFYISIFLLSFVYAILGFLARTINRYKESNLLKDNVLNTQTHIKISMEKIFKFRKKSMAKSMMP